MEKKARPQVVPGSTLKILTGCGNLYTTVNYLDSEPIEVFATLGKAGGCKHCQLEALSRAVSLGLKYGVPLKEFTDEFIGLSCQRPVIGVSGSCPDALAKAFKEAERANGRRDSSP